MEQDQKLFPNSTSSFPQQEIDAYEAYGGKWGDGSWLLGTRGTMRRLAESGTHNPIARLYLAHAFNQTCSPDKDICPFAYELSKKAFGDLERIVGQESHPIYSKANCLLGKEYNSPAFMDHYKRIADSRESSLKYLGNSTEREAILRKSLMEFTLERESSLKHPPIENFLVEEDLRLYPKLFLGRIALLRLNVEEKIRILKEAIKIAPHPVFLIELANGCANNEEALRFLEEAGKQGSPIAYRKMAERYVPYEIRGHYFDFEKAMPDAREKCRFYLQKAADLGLPEAFYNLALLDHTIYSEIYESKLPEEGKLTEESLKVSYRKAAELGFWGAYEALREILDPDDQFFVDYPPLEQEKENLFKQVM